MPIQAVDIAFIPPLPVLEQAVALNQQLNDPARHIPLDIDHVVPHLTLAMAMVRTEDLPLLQKGLDDMARRYLPLELVFDSLYQIQLEDGRPITGLNVQRSRALQQLHEDAMGLLMPYAVQEYHIASLAQHEGADPITLDFIRNFPKGAGEKFNPHVTIGFGRLSQSDIPTEPFSADNLSLYQLGNYCTCRQLISQHRLNSAPSHAS